MVLLYRLLSELFDSEAGVDDPRLAQVADITAVLNERACTSSQSTISEVHRDDVPFDLRDGLAGEADPRVARLLELMRERGWNGIARLGWLPKPPSAMTARGPRPTSSR